MTTGDRPPDRRAPIPVSGSADTARARRPPKRPPGREAKAERPARGPGRGLAVLVASLAGAAAAALWAGKRAGRDVPPVYRSLRAAPRELDFRGHRVTYYERGPADAETVVFVHSIHAAASAWEVREPFTRLADAYRTLAYDILGFGASDRPDVDYDARLAVDLLRGVLRRAAGRPAHVVASSVSAAHALQLAAEEPHLFRSLVLINPTGLLTQATSPGRGSRVAEALLRAPLVGETLFKALVSRASLRFYGGKIYRDPEGASAREAADQQYRTAHQEGARFAPAAFLGDAFATNTYMALRTLEVPTLAVWSDGGEITDTERERVAYQGVRPDLEHVVIEDSGALPHEERPEELTALLRRWLAERGDSPAAPAE